VALASNLCDDAPELADFTCHERLDFLGTYRVPIEINLSSNHALLNNVSEDTRRQLSVPAFRACEFKRMWHKVSLHVRTRASNLRLSFFARTTKASCCMHAADAQTSVIGRWRLNFAWPFAEI
jgi:hypothetical protein